MTQEQERFILHALVFQNKSSELQQVLASSEHANSLYRGQTPLTLAISLARKECVSILLASGKTSTLVKNEGGWTPLQEAISLGDRDIIKVIYMLMLS